MVLKGHSVKVHFVVVVVGRWSLVVGRWLFVVCCLLLVGCWLLVVGVGAVVAVMLLVVVKASMFAAADGTV